MGRAFWLSLALVALPANGERRSVQLDVRGMNCGTCPITVRLALRKVPGVLDAKVTLDPPIAEVTYEDAKTNAEHLTRATAGAGFPSSVRKLP